MTTSFEFDQPDSVGPTARNDTVIEIANIVRSADQNSDRSKQVRIGPSEVWSECLRKQAYKLAGWPTINLTSDPWAAIVGTAAHAWLAAAFQRWNVTHRQVRFLIEQRVQIRPGMWGTADLMDLQHMRVLDHKIVGESTMKRVRRGDVPEYYRRQLHLYGLGMARRGLTPKEVSLIVYPRNGVLAGIWCEPEPYDESLALEALERMDSVAQTVKALDLANNPDGFALIKPTAGHSCMYCAYWSPTSDRPARGCRGMLDQK